MARLRRLWNAAMNIWHLVSTLAACLLIIPATHAAEPPADYCRRVGVDDMPRPIPAALVPAAQRLFGLQAPDDVVRRMTVFRCMGGKVLICATGANLACGKANTDRHLVSAGQYCREHPDAPSIPMFVTGHDTIYAWRCRGTAALASEPVDALDARGFMARLWKPLDQQ